MHAIIGKGIGRTPVKPRKLVCTAVWMRLETMKPRKGNESNCLLMGACAGLFSAF